MRISRRSGESLRIEWLDERREFAPSKRCYLQVQSTSDPVASWAPPVHVAVFPSGQVTLHDCLRSALLAEHVLSDGAAALVASSAAT
jgi:hypothetical protein